MSGVKRLINIFKLLDQMAKNMPRGDKDAKTGPGAPPAQDPKIVAEQLKTSLEGIKESTEYLMKSDYVK